MPHAGGCQARLPGDVGHEAMVVPGRRRNPPTLFSLGILRGRFDSDVAPPAPRIPISTSSASSSNDSGSPLFTLGNGRRWRPCWRARGRCS